MNDMNMSVQYLQEEKPGIESKPGKYNERDFVSCMLQIHPQTKKQLSRQNKSNSKGAVVAVSGVL